MLKYFATLSAMSTQHKIKGELSFIHLFRIMLLNMYYVPGVDTKTLGLNQLDMLLVVMELPVEWRR